MNPYTLGTVLRQGDRIDFRPRWTRQVIDGTVAAIKYSRSGDAVSKVYVRYRVHDAMFGRYSEYQWVTPRRIYHVARQ